MSRSQITITGSADTLESPGLRPSLVTVWDDQRDEAYFRCVAAVFAPAFTSGATVLLASYDHDETATA
jgi:uncharacterized membrane-anchored protein